MTEPSPPSFSPRLQDQRLRAGIVGALALAGAVAYALFLHRGAPWASFGGEPIGTWFFWSLAALWAWTALLSAACVSLGFALLARVFRVDVEGRPPLEVLVTSAAAGLAVFGVAMYLVGFAHGFHALVAVALPVAMLASGARPLLAFLRDRLAAWRAEAPPPRDPVARAITILATALGFLGLAIVYLGALAPEAINFDASWTHLPIAVDYARAGAIVPFPGDYDRAMPQLASMVHTWAMIVPSLGLLSEAPLRWMLALHLEFSFFVWTLAGVSALAAWLLDTPRARAAWAAFFLFPAIFVYDKNLGGAADHYLALFGPPLFLAVVRAAPRFELRACALAGLFAGAALLCKYQAVYLLAGLSIVLFALVVGAVRRRACAPKDLAKGLCAGAGVVALVTAPHFLKNAAFYGNPVYPFAQGTFASHPTVPNAPYLVEWILKDYKFRPHHGLVQTVGEALGLALAWPVSAHYSFSQDVPDGGALFTLCLPIAFFVRGRRRLWLGMATGLGALFAWAMVFRVDRHIQGFMPILAASTAAVLTRAWELGGVARAGIAALVGLQVVWGGDAPFYGARERFVAAFDILRASHDGKPGARFAKARPSYRKIADALPADARVLLHEVKPSLGIDRDVILDTPGRQGLVSYAGVRGLRGLHELYRSLGVTHLLWRPGARAASTRQEDVLFSDYVLRYGAHPKRFADKRLVEIPSEPPPEDHSYKVLALGLKGYKDGLYPVEAMTTYEAIPPPPADTHEVYAKPERRFPKDLAAQIELANAADAVCVAESFDGGSRALEAALDARFELAAQHGTFAIYVVRRRDAPEEPGDKPSDKPGEPSGPADVEDDR